MTDLPLITDAFKCDPGCSICHGWGIVCEEHPWYPWESGDVSDCQCGAAGMPCPGSLIEALTIAGRLPRCPNFGCGTSIVEGIESIGEPGEWVCRNGHTFLTSFVPE